MVGIILINYNSFKDTKECVESILRSTYKNIYVIVVDNASEMEDVEALKMIENEKVGVVLNKENVGFAGANNIGIDMLMEKKVSHVLILNNDTIVQDDSIEKLIDYYNCNIQQNPGIISGLILNYYNPKLIWHGGGRFQDYTGGVVIKNYSKSIDETIIRSTMEDTFASGCCMFMPAVLLKKYRMDEGYFLYYEDVDFSRKIIKGGYKIGLSADAIIFHKESASTKKNSSDFVYYFTRNRLMYIKKNIHGISRISAYIYSFLWFIKKAAFDGFNLSDIFSGAVDAHKMVGGKRNVSSK